MAEFKVGDKVVITAGLPRPFIGAKAEVIALEGGFLGLDIDGFEKGHSLSGRLLGKRSGYWLCPECVKRLNEFKGNI